MCLSTAPLALFNGSPGQWRGTCDPTVWVYSALIRIKAVRDGSVQPEAVGYYVPWDRGKPYFIMNELVRDQVEAIGMPSCIGDYTLEVEVRLLSQTPYGACMH